MSNVYEAMGRIVDYAIAYLDIVPDTAASDEDVAAVCKMLDAWSALAPTPEMWAAYPWAQWYAIDANGRAGIFGQEPEIEDLAWVIEWTEESELPVEVGIIDLPLGIDWRLCKWQRPEVTK